MARSKIVTLAAGAAYADAITYIEGDEEGYTRYQQLTVYNQANAVDLRLKVNDADEYLIPAGAVRSLPFPATTSGMAYGLHLKSEGDPVAAVDIEAALTRAPANVLSIRGPAGPAGDDGTDGPAAAASADALIYLNAGTQTVADSADATVEFDGEAHDVGGLLGSPSNHTLTAPEGGCYALHSQITISGQGGTLELRVNGSAIAASPVADDGVGVISLTRELITGDEVTAHFTNGGGVSTDILPINGGVIRSWLHGFRIR